MALNAQLGGTPLPSDIPVFNWSGADIPANIAVKVDPANTVGAGQQGVGIILPAADGDPIIGFTVDKIPAGQSGRLRPVGVAVGLADGSIAAGAWVMASSTGGKLGYVKTQTAAKGAAGIALSAAVDSDQVLVLVALGKNA